MSWMTEHKTAWRAAALIMLVVAITGPWTFEVIWVPSDPPFSSCSAPYVRLDEDFCGTPLSGKWLLGWMVSGLVSATSGLLQGANDFSEWAREVLLSLLLSLLVLPFFSTLLLILRGNRRREQVFTIAAWSLAGGTGLLIGLFSYPRLSWVLWGLWAHVGLAVSTLTLEVLSLTAGRGSS